MAYLDKADEKKKEKPLLWVAETANGWNFVQQFNRTFDSNLTQLASLYRDGSQISFEGATVQGPNAFIQRIQQLKLPQGSLHRAITVDAQPSAAGGGAILLFTTGEYVGQQYSEIFHLVNQGSLYVHNDIFRVGNTNPFNVPEAAASVAKGFIEFYYSTFDSNRANLIPVYRPTSCYTYEDSRVQGISDIVEKLQEMPDVIHDPSSITADVQQVNGNALLLVFVTGRLMIRDESNALNFTEMFQLVQEGQQYFVGNHFFRFKYG